MKLMLILIISMSFLCDMAIEYLGIKDIKVNISLLNDRYDSDYEIISCIWQNPYDKKEIFIYLKENIMLNQSIYALSHEMIHVKQISEGRLELLDDAYIWNGDTTRYTDVEYHKRPHEIEAFRESKKLYKYLRQLK